MNNGKPVASSREISIYFEKEHKNVKRDIDKLIEEIGSKMSAPYFVKSEYRDSQNRLQEEYLKINKTEIPLTLDDGMNVLGVSL